VSRNKKNRIGKIMSEKSNHLLELVMFDIAYVISNCDYQYSSDEKKYLDVILDRYDEQDKELLKLRTQFLDSILEKGIEEVKNFVVNLSKSLKSKIGEDMKDAYLELFKEVIMLDKNIHDNERVLYQLLCEQWGRESGI
jgi:hypothetical protein|tara:strand:- start:1076 stop:1492 length:417 start_codon:yes stop_codon:yes gene_type:complete